MKRTMAMSVVVLALNAASHGIAQQDPGQLYRDALRLFSEHKTTEAIAALQRFVELRPKQAEGWRALGVVYAAQRDIVLAVEPFRMACTLDPSLSDACLYYGRALYLLNRFQSALAVLRGALEKDPGNAQVHRLMALSYQGLGATNEAGQAFQQAIRLERGSPADEDPRLDYGVYLFRLGRAEAALAPIEAVLRLHPDGARAHLELGCILLALERLPEAEGHLERAVALDSKSARAHLLLGKTYLRLGKKALGEEHLRQGSRTVK